jgi:hypothetical protein
MKGTNESMHAETLALLREIKNEMRAVREEARRLSVSMTAMAVDIHQLMVGVA